MLKLNSILQIAAVFFIVVGASEQMCTESQKDLGCCDGPFREHNGVVPEWQLSTIGGGSWIKGESWIQFNIDNDINCGGVGNAIQKGTATIDFYVGQAETIVISMQGVAESQYEKFDLYVDEELKASVQATNGLNNGCQVSTCIMCDVSMPSQEFDVSIGNHQIRIEMDTIDGVYHNNAYFRMDFLIKQKEVCGACTCPTVNTAPGAVLTADPSNQPTAFPTSDPSVSPTTAHPTSLPSIAPTTEEPTNAPSVSTTAPTVPSTSSTSTDLCVSGVDCQTKCDAEYGASFAVDVDVSLETNTCTCTTETTIKEYIEEFSSVEEISGTVEIDMQILMDATGSMSSSIQAMSNAVIEMLDNIVADVKADTGFDAILRVGVVGYRDPFVGDEHEFIPFTFDNAAVDQFLGNLAAVGGGDWEEDVNGGLKIMLDQEWTSEHKFIVHIADANGLGIPAPDAVGIDYADLFAEINEKQITYIFGKLNSNTDPMIAAYNEVYAVNEAGVLVEDASDAEIDILNLQGLSTSDMTATFTTELVNKIVTRVEEKVVTQELGQWAICDDLEEEDIVRDNKVLIVICGSTTIVICCCCFCVCCLMRKKEDEDDKNIVVEVKIDGGDFDKRTPSSCTAAMEKRVTE